MPQDDYSSAVTDIKTAPHSIPTDGDPNPAFKGTASTPQQFPFVEINQLDIGGSVGSLPATDLPIRG
jgi:hypothetical protein